LHTPWQHKLYTKLISLQYKIVYKPGASNQAADALSRHPSPSAQLQNLSSVTPTWLADVVAGYDKDPATSKIIQEVIVSQDSNPHYTFTDGIL
jgi:hypothetical protein